MDIKLKSTSEYKKTDLEEVLKYLETDTNGLDSKEAETRQKKYGFNEITEAKKNPILRFLKRYWGPMPWLLEFSIILTVILRHYSESIIIFTLLTINAVIGFLQSQNSQKAVKLLKKKLEVKAKVLRNRNWVFEDAKNLVPGDIISIKLGDIVPADVFVINGEISADESSLTGESLPKNLRESDIVYSSTVIKGGEAKGIVINTGLNTFFGKTVDLVKKAKPKSKQEEIMLSIVKYMMYLGIAASAVVSVYAVYLHKSLLFIISFVVIFLIGAIPVALPAVLSIVQAVGALTLSKKGILVTRLDSIEDASSIDIFCFDKTGTITQNKLTVTQCSSFGKYNDNDVIRMATLASSKEGMDAIDLAIIQYAETLHISTDEYEKILFIPFSPLNKRVEAVVKIQEKNLRIYKGAPQTIIGLCENIENDIKKHAVTTVDEFSQQGYRTIAVALKNEDQNYPEFLGLIAISDPPRDDSEHMIAEIKSLGIRPIMLTGDSIAIAGKISGEVGIGNRIKRISELNGLSHDEKLKLIENSDGFAEVYPEDKYNIVKLLQDNGHMVGMTGDGVNDSPALKQAELGTAVSGATDVANASASIVLTKPGLSEIIDAIKISRQTYQRMLTWVINKITKVVEVVVLFTVGFFWLHDIVISLLGMSLLVFANDFVTMSIATDNVKSTANPNSWNMKNITLSSLILGTAFALEDLFIVFISLHYFHVNLEILRTIVLLSLVFNTQFRILIVRERKHFYSSFPNKKMLAVNIMTIILFALLGIFGIIIPKLSIYQVSAVLGIAILFMFGIDSFKYYLFKKFDV